MKLRPLVEFANSSVAGTSNQLWQRSRWLAPVWRTTSVTNDLPMWAIRAPASGSARLKVRRTYAEVGGFQTTAVICWTRLLSEPYVWPAGLVSPVLGMAVPWPSIASTPPTVRSPGAGVAVRPSPLASSAVRSASIVAPAWARTRDVAVSTVTAVSLVLVSTSTTLAASLPPAAKESGDQLCELPLARSRQPLDRAQLARVTTSAGVFGVHVHTSSTAIAPDQFLYVCWKSGTPLGKVGGVGRAAWAAGICSNGSQAATPATAAPCIRRRRDSPPRWESFVASLMSCSLLSASPTIRCDARHCNEF